MKNDRKYILILAIVFAASVWLEYNIPQPIDWKPSFSNKEKIPYGSFIIYDYLSAIFPGKKINESAMPVYNSLSDTMGTKSNYLFVNTDFNPDTLDVKKMLNYVQSGNTVFIAVEDYSGALADSLKVQTSTDISIVNSSKDSVSLNFTTNGFHSPKNFSYQKGSVDYYFTKYDTAHTEILGKNSNGKPDYIKITRGNGAFYLSSVPKAFTNYNALKNNNSEYIFRALSYLPIEDVYWDEYYKTNKLNAATPLRYILNNPALEYAYYLMIVSMLIYVFFEGKRKQRAIPVITPLENTSLEFVETIGLLYFQKGENSTIAKKKIQFFFDYLRNRYNIAAKLGNKEYFTSLIKITGIEKAEIEKLFFFIFKVNESKTIDNDTLIKLSNMIENFHQKTN